MRPADGRASLPAEETAVSSTQSQGGRRSVAAFVSLPCPASPSTGDSSGWIPSHPDRHPPPCTSPGRRAPPSPHPPVSRCPWNLRRPPPAACPGIRLAGHTLSPARGARVLLSGRRRGGYGSPRAHDLLGQVCVTPQPLAVPCTNTTRTPVISTQAAAGRSRPAAAFSWRVCLLKYIEEGNLYRQFGLDEH